MTSLSLAAGLDGLNELVGAGADDVDVLVLALEHVPGVLEGLDVDRRAVVVGGLLVHLDGDGLLAVLDFALDVFAEVLVRRGRAVEVEASSSPRCRRAASIGTVQGGVVRAVAVVGEAVEVRPDAAQRQGDGAALLQVLGVLGVDADRAWSGRCRRPGPCRLRGRWACRRRRRRSARALPQRRPLRRSWSDSSWFSLHFLVRDWCL